MKTSILKAFSLAYNNLQRAYQYGEIPYPRVANDYIMIDGLKFYEYPHKPLFQFDEFSAPLQKEEYLIEKATLPLLLTNKKISTPATLYKNLQFIDLFLDDDMKLRGNMEDIEEKLVSVMEILRETAADLYMNEVEAGKIRFDRAPEEMDDSDLLWILAKDGEVFAGFRHEPMLYSVYAPNINISDRAKDKKDDSDDDMALMPLDRKVDAFKSILAPSANYPQELSAESVWVQNLETALMLEDVRLLDVQMRQKLMDDTEKRDIALNNLSAGVLSERDEVSMRVEMV